MHGRRNLFASTLLVVAIHTAAVWAFWRLFTHQLDFALGLAMAFLLTHLVAITLLLGGSVIVKILRLRRDAGFLRIEPETRAALAAHAAGVDCAAELRRLYTQSHDATVICLVDALGSVRGSGRDRLAQLAAELGVLREWEAQCFNRGPRVRREAVAALGLAGCTDGGVRRALDDTDEFVRMEAARVLLASSSQEDLERIFARVIGQPLLVRILLGTELMKHSAVLAAHAIPAALDAGNTQQTIRVLETLAGWGRFVPVPGVEPLLHHAEATVRVAAVRALRYCVQPPDAASHVRAILEDSDAVVRAEGARMAGKMRMVEAVPWLTGLLEDAIPHTRLTAAYALGEIGQAGWNVLEHAISGASAASAGPALEALERVRIGRITEGPG